MPRFSSRLTLILSLMTGILASGCNDETTIVRPLSGGAVFGRTDPVEANTRVEVWQKTLIMSTTVDSRGYFSISGLEAGLYSVRFLAPSGAAREIHAVGIDALHSTSLGTVHLSRLPKPLIAITPGEETSPDALDNPVVSLEFEEEVDRTSIASAVHFNPVVEGTWVSNYSDYDQYSYSYAFNPRDSYPKGQTYTVTIDATLKLASGVAWGASKSFSFRTAGLRAGAPNWYNVPDPNHPVYSPGYTGTIIQIPFNGRVDIGSLEDGITVTPALALQYDLYSYNSNSTTVTINASQPLKTGQTYSLELGIGIRDVGGAALENPGTLVFDTSGFQLVRRTFRNGSQAIPANQTDVIFSDEYNAFLDNSTILTAISIEPAVSFNVQSNSRSFSFYVTEDLRPSTTYTVSIGPDLSALDGTKFGTTQSVTFSTEALRVVSFYASSNENSGVSGVVDPGSSLFLRVYLNSEADASLFNEAVTISPPLAGFWFLVDANYSSGSHMDFLPTTALNLAPEQTYTVTISGNRPLIDETTLGADYVRSFSVRPVTITSFSPGTGARNVSIYFPDTNVEFNTSMDRAGTESAIRVETLAGVAVAGTFEWYSYSTPPDRSVRFRPVNPLSPQTSYRFVVATTARSVSGATLKVGRESVFTTGTN